MKTQVLGNWQPTKLECETIKIEFYDHLFQLVGPFSSSEYEIRPPLDHNRFVDVPLGTQRPHTDRQRDDMIVWSNIIPTVVILNDGTVMSTAPGDIILINNHESEHMQPLKHGERWFVRLSNIMVQ